MQHKVYTKDHRFEILIVCYLIKQLLKLGFKVNIFTVYIKTQFYFSVRQIFKKFTNHLSNVRTYSVVKNKPYSLISFVKKPEEIFKDAHFKMVKTVFESFSEQTQIGSCSCCYPDLADSVSLVNKN